MFELLSPLAEHVARLSALRLEDAERLVAEVIAFFDQDVEAYVQERHRALKREGLKNDEIYARIADELQSWRFKSPALTARQIRRMIYG